MARQQDEGLRPRPAGVRCPARRGDHPPGPGSLPRGQHDRHGVAHGVGRGAAPRARAPRGAARGPGRALRGSVRGLRRRDRVRPGGRPPGSVRAHGRRVPLGVDRRRLPRVGGAHARGPGPRGARRADGPAGGPGHPARQRRGRGAHAGVHPGRPDLHEPRGPRPARPGRAHLGRSRGGALPGALSPGRPRGHRGGALGRPRPRRQPALRGGGPGARGRRPQRLDDLRGCAGAPGRRARVDGPRDGRGRERSAHDG